MTQSIFKNARNKISKNCVKLLNIFVLLTIFCYSILIIVERGRLKGVLYLYRILLSTGVFKKKIELKNT